MQNIATNSQVRSQKLVWSEKYYQNAISTSPNFYLDIEANRIVIRIGPPNFIITIRRLHNVITYFNVDRRRSIF